MRIGLGFDIHRFTSRGGTLKLGGVTIPHSRGLAGHSDGDVLLHAIADALLGAIAGPDLGELFPSSDPSLRQADSRRFVEHSYALVRRAGWRVANLDAVVVSDAPRLAPHKPKILQALGRLLALPPEAVSVKSKTTEGFSPGADGISAQAVVLLERAKSTRALRAQGPEPDKHRRRGRPARDGARGSGLSKARSPQSRARSRR